MGLAHQSTRGGEKEVAAFVAILQGLAEDGGLFMPSGTPELDMPLEKLVSMTYQEIAHEVMKLFSTDYTEAELKDCITRAYDSEFDVEGVVPLAKADGAYYPELYHGNTVIFKDMALPIPLHLITAAAKENHMDREIVILTAMSGDMGKMAIARFADAPGTRIIIFYPKDGVSKVREPQMRTQKGDNTSVVAVRGDFDDAQTGVKKTFGDKDLGAELAGKGFRFPSANSIDISRLISQIVCYVYAYAELLEAGEVDKGERINVVVSTGSFDNIFMAYFAKRMGSSVKILVYTSSDDKVSYDFFATGIYDRKRGFILTNSPPMDILMSNNLEHLICLSTEYDAQTNAALMRRLSEEGGYEATSETCTFTLDFAGGFTTQEQDATTIRRLLDDTGYLIDTHTGATTAVYANYRRESGDGTKIVVTSVVSPHKFSHSIMEAIAGKEGLGDKDEFEIVDASSALPGVATPQVVEEIRHAAVRHNKECGMDDMRNEMKDTLDTS